MLFGEKIKDQTIGHTSQFKGKKVWDYPLGTKLQMFVIIVNIVVFAEFAPLPAVHVPLTHKGH